MAQSYKITQVSSQPPREWAGPKGTVYYIKLKLEGHPKPVSIGKRSPDALHVGDVVYGTITADYNHEEDKFKSEPNPNFTGTSRTGAAKVSDDRSFYVAYAKDLAVALITSNPGAYTIEEHWDKILDLVNIGGRILQSGDLASGIPTQADVNDEVAAAIEMFTGSGDVDESF